MGFWRSLFGLSSPAEPEEPINDTPVLSMEDLTVLPGGEDPETGFPLLPVGFFWRVMETHKDSVYLRVQLMYRDDKEPLEWYPIQRTEVNADSVARATRHIAGKFTEVSRRRINGIKAESFIGDYVPKSKAQREALPWAP